MSFERIDFPSVTTSEAASAGNKIHPASLKTTEMKRIAGHNCGQQIFSKPFRACSVIAVGVSVSSGTLARVVRKEKKTARVWPSCAE